MGTEALRLRP